jgi:hypothetical protein
MAICIAVTFGRLFYLEHGLSVFIAMLFFLGLFGGSFALFSLWIPEQYPTLIRVTAFSFIASVGRFVGAGVNMVLAAAILGYGSAGIPVATTAVAFVIGLFLIPKSLETRGTRLPD